MSRWRRKKRIQHTSHPASRTDFKFRKWSYHDCEEWFMLIGGTWHRKKSVSLKWEILDVHNSHFYISKPQSDQLNLLVSFRNDPHKGRGLFADQEAKLYEMYKRRRAKGMPVSFNWIMAKMRILIQIEKPSHYRPDKHKFGKTWAFRFCRRWSISLYVSQKTPSLSKTPCLSFWALDNFVK